MSNRRQPFGYRLQAGAVAINADEADVVRLVFQQYVAGLSLNKLVEELEKQPIRYAGEKPWNRNMVSRILDDSRYAGDKEFPAIVSQDELIQAASMKASKPQLPQKTETEKIIRQLSGVRVTGRIAQQVLDLLNSLAGHAEKIVPQNDPTAGNIGSLNLELDKVLSCLPLDEEKAKTLTMQVAAAQYKAIGASEYETERLRRVFASMQPMVRLDASLIRTTISEIISDKDGAIMLRLKNQQVIGAT